MTTNLRKKPKLKLFGWGGVSACLVLAGCLALLFSAPKAHASTPSGSILNYKKSSIVGAETTCTNDLAYQNAHHASDDARTRINNSNPYKQIPWITAYGHPDQPINASVGQANVGLQLNIMQFNCAVLVHDNNTNGNGGRAAAASDTKVTNSLWPNNRMVYGDADGGVHAASRYELRTQIEGASIVSVTDAYGHSVSKGSFCSPSTIDPGKILLTSRGSGGGGSASSRYWLSDQTENFTYCPAGGKFTKALNITLDFTVKYLNTYHDVLGGGDDANICTGSGGKPNVHYHSQSDIQWSICPNYHVRVAFHVGVPPNVSSVTADDTCKNVTGFAQDGDYPNSPVTVELRNQYNTVLGTVKTNSAHKFSIPLPAATQHNVQWTNLPFKVIAYGLGSGGNTTVSFTIGPCATLACGTSTFPAATTIGVPVTFSVNMNTTNATVNPPGSPTFDITVTGHGSGTNSQTYPNIADNPVSGGHIDSNSVSFTPAAAGTYTISWHYYGTHCNDQAEAAYLPFFNAIGGDIAAGTGFGAGCSQDASADIKSWNRDGNPSGTYSGAGAQFAAFALGDITHFVSSSDVTMGSLGTGLSGVGVPVTQHPYNLSFANSGSVHANDFTNFGGKFNQLPCAPDYASLVAAGSPSGAVDYHSAGARSYVEADGFDVHIGGTHTMGAGARVTIKVNGSAYISSDMLYGSTSLNDISSLRVYATGGIYIKNTVQELHGTFVAQGGPFATCATSVGTDQTGYGPCNHPLTVWGAVAAKSMRLERSFGSLSSGSGPAESFRYTPELWLPSNAGLTCAATGCPYDSITSLPPVL